MNTPPLSDEHIARQLLEQVKIRMDHRLNVILKRDGAEKAVTGPGVGISYLFASEIHRACEQALLVLDSQAAGRAVVREELGPWLALYMAREIGGSPEEIVAKVLEMSDKTDAMAAALVAEFPALRSPQAQTLQADTAHHAESSDPSHGGTGVGDVRLGSLPPVGPQSPGEQWREIAEQIYEQVWDEITDGVAPENTISAIMLKLKASPPGAKPAEPEGMGLTREELAALLESEVPERLNNGQFPKRAFEDYAELVLKALKAQAEKGARTR